MTMSIGPKPTIQFQVKQVFMLLLKGARRLAIFLNKLESPFVQQGK